MAVYRVPQQVQKLAAVRVLPIDVLLRIAPRSEVVQRSSKLDAQGPGHLSAPLVQELTEYEDVEGMSDVRPDPQALPCSHAPSVTFTFQGQPLISCGVQRQSTRNSPS